MAKKDTFVEWRKEQQKETIVLIRKALMLLASATYNNITRLAKDVAALVTEFQIHANALLPVEKQKEIQAVSYTTLLRNEAYKNILKVALAEQNPTKGNLSTQKQGVTELDILRVENSNLKESIKNLQAKIRKIDSGESILLESMQGADPKKEQMVEDIKFLIQFALDLHNQVKDAFEIIQDEKTNEDRPVPGLYGPDGLVATWDEMKHLERVQYEYYK